MHIDAEELSSTLSLDLYEAGWNGELIPYPGQPIRQFAMSHLYKSLVKKYLPGTSLRNPTGDAAALDLFTKVNESCRTWRLDTSGFSDLEAVALGEFRLAIDKFFLPGWSTKLLEIDGPPTPERAEMDPCLLVEVEEYQCSILSQGLVRQGFGLGNGANIGAPESDLFSKLATSSMAATDPSLHIDYVHAISSNPTWTEMEHLRSKKMGYQIVKGSRLSFVPKTAKISRTICTEPILNMLYQKGIAACIQKRLRQVYAIDLSVQPDYNREFARIGSLTGKFGTIDLSSASDTISLSFCKEFLPQQVLDCLLRYRSPSTTLPGGKEVELHMISSMGNAFTFPLQTMLFSALVCSCYRAYGIQPIHSRGSSHGNYAVFGDDIIVLERAYNLVCRMLSVLGFTVNADKSFNEGQFRESCGSDWLSGHYVRGVYIESLRDMCDCYSAINRLIRWSAHHSIRLTHLVKLLRHRVRFLPVPYDEQDIAGIKVPYDMVDKIVLHTHTKAVYYRYVKLVERQVRIPPNRKGCKLHGFFDNEPGLLVAFLAGSIRNGLIVLRSNRRKAVIRKRYSSRWDYIPDALPERAEYAERWKTLARAMLSEA